MDYAVGSLSDLITGSVTPNKKKVIKKQIAKASPLMETSPVTSDVEENSIVSRPKKKALKSKPTKKVLIVNGSSGGELLRVKPKNWSEDENVDKPKKTGKKRDLPIGENGEKKRPAKKSKIEKNTEQKLGFKDHTGREQEDPELAARTVYVGNIPLTLTAQRFKRMFAKFGKVETVRFRGAPVADPKTSKKVAVIKKKFHPDRKSFYGFVRYVERESAVKAAAEGNGILFQDHHLFVRLCDIKEKPDETRAVFVGNLDFKAEEEDLWKTFISCGSIESVRCVRDKRSGMGKGFGYVNFVSSDAVALALEMENIKINGRELRVSLCDNSACKKSGAKERLKNKIKKPRTLRSPKKETGEGNQESDVKIEKKSFQGATFVTKKKKTFNKGLLQKKKMIKQLAPK